jgi:pyruvate,water dikinase
MRRYIIDLFSRSARREGLAGGKAATLAKLHARGFNIVPGFVVSTDVFRFLTDGVSLQKGMFRGAEFPPGIAGAIRKKFRGLGGPVAVRSSLVGEDSARASHAGQLDSFLGVKTEEDLFDSIRKVYESLLGPRWSSYSSHVGDRAGSPALPGGVAMAVLVQRMVEPDSGGVVFSADPDTGRVCTIVEAVRGSPSAVVGGRANPERYVVDSRGVLEASETPAPHQSVLDETRLRELARIATEISFELETPQDIEWAFDPPGFLVLQARPITPLAGKNIYSRKLAADMAPGLIKPLYWSTNIQDMARNVFGRVFGEIIGPGIFEPTDLVRCIRSRVFANVTLFADLFARIGLPINLFEVLARGESAIRKRPRITPRFIWSAGKLALFLIRHGWSAGRARAFLGRHASAMENLRKKRWSDEGSEKAYAAIRDLRRLHGETQWYMWITAICMMARKKMMSRFLARRCPGVNPLDLLAGYIDLKSLEPNEAMMSIAGEVRILDPDLGELMARENDEAIRGKLAGMDGGSSVLKRFDGFMERYGHLSASGTDFTVPPWKENPGLIWNTIGRMASAPSTEAGAVAGKVREAATSKAIGDMNRLNGFLFSRLLNGTITYLKLRERVSFCMSEDAFQMRRLYLSLGVHLVSCGRIELAEDVFYMMSDELDGLVAGSGDVPAMRKTIRDRRAAIEADAGVEVPDIVCGENVGTEPGQVADDAECLVGIPGSPGVTEGRARVVTDPYGFRPEHGETDILVVPFMDIGWTPLFSSIAGIVAETGGQLSHSAIIAREFGLPAVVGVRRATHIIRSGQTISIDGGRGIVRLGNMGKGME